VEISSKLPRVGTTIFTTMSALAHEHGAINLSQGYPDYNPPPALLELCAAAMHDGHNQYAPMAGLPDLREQLASLGSQRFGTAIDPDSEVTVVPGATEALFCAIMALVQQGDEVILLDPAYDSYEPAVELAGGRAVHVPLAAPDFTVDWQVLTDHINQRTRMLVINTPHNPTGSVLSAADLTQLATILRDTRVLLLSDEVYEYLVYDDHQHASVLAQPELRERSVAVFSFGKTFHATGWKTGYCIAPPEVTTELRKVHQYVTFVANTPVQHALAGFYANDASHLAGLSQFYQAKRDRFCRALANSRFKFKPSAGTYFQLVDYSDISDLDDLAFCQWLTREVGVAAIPLSPFYAEPPPARLARFCFAKQDETLDAAAEILCRL
jgi:methionine aminotransferase